MFYESRSIKRHENIERVKFSSKYQTGLENFALILSVAVTQLRYYCGKG